GIVFALSAWLAVRGAWGPGLANGRVLIAFGLLALGGALVVVVTRRVAIAHRYPIPVVALAVTPGAIVLARAAPLVGSTLSRTLFALATIGFAVAIRDFDAMHGRKGAPWLLFAVTAGGVYLAVPDTELARALFGVAIPFILLSVPRPLSPLGPAGSTA